jgi:hypothetical protein
VARRVVGANYTDICTIRAVWLRPVIGRRQGLWCARTIVLLAFLHHTNHLTNYSPPREDTLEPPITASLFHSPQPQLSTHPHTTSNPIIPTLTLLLPLYAIGPLLPPAAIDKIPLPRAKDCSKISSTLPTRIATNPALLTYHVQMIRPRTRRVCPLPT